MLSTQASRIQLECTHRTNTKLGFCKSVSASLNRRSENVAIEAVVVFELTFRDVEREVFPTDLVVTAGDRPLKDRPKILDCIADAS